MGGRREVSITCYRPVTRNDLKQERSFFRGSVSTFFQLVVALRKSKQPLSQECGFFLWIDQPISHGIKDRLSYSPQPRVTRFQPYWEIKEMFEKHRQEAKQEAFIHHQRHTRKSDEGLEICDNGFNSLGSPNIFHGLRYREWMHEVWESYKFYVQKMKEDSRDDPDATLCLEKDDVLRQAYYKYAREDGHHPGC